MTVLDPRFARHGLALALATAVALLPLGAAQAQVQPPPPANVVSLSASASVEVVNDWLTLVLSTSREGADANAVQAQLRQALDSALTEARKVARPGQLELQTGQFSLFPRYAPPTPRSNGAVVPGGIVGWQGNTELILQGRDTQAITQLAGRISSMTVARVGFSLSREARDKVEASVTAQAIERFRERASAVTRAFGMGSHALREVQISGDEAPPPVQRSMMRAQATSLAAGDMSLPVEAGNATVSVNVSGTVQMAK
jgi:predicted secreted protein